MVKKIIPPRIQKVEDTEIGKKLASDPAEQARHDKFVSKFREAARLEIEDLERSRCLTWSELRDPIFR